MACSEFREFRFLVAGISLVAIGGCTASPVTVSGEIERNPSVASEPECRATTDYEPDFESLMPTPQAALGAFRAAMLQQIREREGSDRLPRHRARMDDMEHVLDGLGENPRHLEVDGSRATIGTEQDTLIVLEAFDGGWAVTQSIQNLPQSDCVE